MDSSDDESSLLLLNLPEDAELNPRANEEVVVNGNRLRAEDDFLNDQSSLATLTFGEGDGAPSIKPRAYQLEMLEESLEKNIIVAMDTGSGKTHIAILRILHELECMPSNKLIWFLAPTIALCSQQFEVIQSQASSVQVKFLSGVDNVDRWTEQTLWDAILKNVKIVVSTYQVLYDALVHAFVRMEALALIVFDEGRTPTKHRAELRLQVKLPLLEQITYRSLPHVESLTAYTETIKSLSQVYLGLNILEDPYILGLFKENTEKSMAKLNKIRLNRKTWSQDQIKTVHATSLRICSELGGWAADYYISRVVTKFLKMVDEEDSDLQAWDVSGSERRYVAEALRKVKVTFTFNELPAAIPLVSDKFNKMVETLLKQPPGFAGIVFVKERATVAALAHLLSVHPDTRGRFRIGAMVGTSTSTYRARNVGELADVDAQKYTLSHFKAGIINLIIATSVLEEGIDVPACNLVLCYEKPANLKSFVQRRGRARHQDSKLILLLDSADNKLSEWQQLESEMKTLYEDEMRVLQEALIPEDTEEGDSRCFRVDASGATLDLDNAVQHLYHFCATLPKGDYVDLRPEFICSNPGIIGHKSCRVILPLSVHEAVRTAQSRRSWMSERNAIKDSAFEAYVQLFNAGLVNQNLLPLLRHDPVVDDLANTVETRASLTMAKEQHNPWLDVAKAWRSLTTTTTSSIITCEDLSMTIHLPYSVPGHSYELHWNSKTVIPVVVSESSFWGGHLPKQDDTRIILSAAFGHRFEVELKEFIVLFSSADGQQLTDQIAPQPTRSGGSGIVRDRRTSNVLYLFKEWLEEKPPRELVQKPYEGYDDSPQNEPHLSLKRLPRRLDYLHKISSPEVTSEKLFPEVLPISSCVADALPFKYMQFGLFIPSIMRRLEVYMLADKLSATLLKDAGIRDIDLVVTAICASSACEATNYQRLEFIGDSILKLCASVQLTAEFPLWHEGYLSAKKDRLVSNSRLSRAAIESGLDQYIITKAFTGHKWRPQYIDDLLQEREEKNRQISTKVLADVVEALIGAAMMDGGISKALACLRIFLPEQDWQPLDSRRSFLYQRASEVEAGLPGIDLLQELVGYRFRKHSLLVEAMSHASCVTGSASLERFEFLGDSILDHLIVRNLQKHDLSHVKMHLLRTALVNADFLAFLCMEWAVEQDQTDIVEDAYDGSFAEKTATISLPLWKFMRHHTPQLGDVQVATAKRHVELRGDIGFAITSGLDYPWALLSRLQARKFYSDIVESLLGAVWIDSGSFDVCEGVVERMGILPYLRRILKDGVNIWHPKEELGLLAGDRTVRYEPSVNKTVIKGESEYTCKVSVGGVLVVDVRGGVGKDEVMVKAAEAAVRIMKSGTGKEGGNDGDVIMGDVSANVTDGMVMDG